MTSKVTSSNSSRRSANSLNLASSIPRIFRSPLTPPAPAVFVQRQPIEPHCLAAVATNQESGIRNQSSVFRFQTSDTKDEALGTKHGCFLSASLRLRERFVFRNSDGCSVRSPGLSRWLLVGSAAGANVEPLSSTAPAVYQCRAVVLNCSGCLPM